MMESLSARDARRIALTAQGFGKASAVTPSRRKLLDLVERLGVIQIDSVNVVSRAHYMPLYSRLGAYPRELLEDLAWGRKPQVFEYWAHEASLLPHERQPLFRWRMADARSGVGVWGNVARFLQDHKHLVESALAQIRQRGPLAASELDIGSKGEGGWWGWSDAKRAVECLFWAGEVMATTRRRSFERVYALPEAVLPSAILSRPTPSRRDAHRELVRLSAEAMGVATARDLRDYYRLGLSDSKSAIEELVEAGDLTPVRVEGWKDMAYLTKELAKPAVAKACTLLSPFDNAIWFRERTERLFGVRIVLEIYTPAPKRVYGYYVLPFLEGDAITARVDLKADRKASVLVVQASHLEALATRHTVERLAVELRGFAAWLGLAAVRVENRGAMAAALSVRLAGSF
ncbi:winged helix-turn-helix domain-containing protein [Asticcacaulis benevestitus]|nr:winged helix-turn-helix domain-containing protein [Asticcacaulis benevestitus]